MAVSTDTSPVRLDPLGDRIDAMLAGLPPAYVLAHQDAARLVVGPYGAFVIHPADGDVAAAADRLTELTSTTRNALFDHLTWVPFVDAIVVTRTTRPRNHQATVVPLDLLADVLTQGREVVDAGTLNAIRDAVRTARLDGWRVGDGSAGDRIDLCDPVPTTALPR